MTTLTLELDEAKARALAQLAARLTFADLARLSHSTHEQAAMEQALDDLRNAIARSGVLP